MHSHLLSLEPLWAFSTCWSLKAGQARDPIHSSGTRRTRYPRRTLYEEYRQLAMYFKVSCSCEDERCYAADSTYIIRRLTSACCLITIRKGKVVCTHWLQKLKLETHPFTFLSLSSFGSCNPVKTTITLHRQRKMVTFNVAFGHNFCAK